MNVHSIIAIVIAVVVKWKIMLIVIKERIVLHGFSCIEVGVIVPEIIIIITIIVCVIGLLWHNIIR
jgi:hypothetical protein